MSTPTSAPPGWYDDGSGRQRWWDGTAWGQFAPQSPPPAVLTEAPQAAPKKPNWYKNKWVWLGALMVVLVIIIAVNVARERAVEATPISVPDVTGQDGGTAYDTLTALGFDVELEADGASVWVKSNWTVDAQDPAPGESAVAGDTVTLTVSKPGESAETTPSAKPSVVPSEEPSEEPSEPAPAALSEVNAAQFLAYAWEDRFPYGGTVHWIADRITTPNADGTFTFKIGATLKTESGGEVKATIEGDVGGTNDAPEILDSILYTSTGDIIEY